MTAQELLLGWKCLNYEEEQRSKMMGLVVTGDETHKRKLVVLVFCSSVVSVPPFLQPLAHHFSLKKKKKEKKKMN